MPSLSMRADVAPSHRNRYMAWMFPSAVVGLPWVSTAKALAFSTWHLALSGNTNSLVASFRRATTSAVVKVGLLAPEVSPRVMGRRRCILTSGPETATVNLPVLYRAAAVPSAWDGTVQARSVREIAAFMYIVFSISRRWGGASLAQRIAMMGTLMGRMATPFQLF